MNRFKKELKKHGVMLEHEYDYLPYPVGGNVVLEGVIVNAETATVATYYNTIALFDHYGRDFSIVEQDFD